ncbi:MAG: hypothetical protein RMY16_29875 [Nostoc sp. DedQUE12b]|uniref:hypothetical protein n=1 Tax=Nostoc sp. DedQUE12b TaxID=3075398 RepID=UPI002AD2BFFD|nr:hypothetical protein [Nostoc sp. DedQUE12b]MDZ8089729.1 hypothetical protein [Nostoc sp. DedQUE12b]
MGTSVFVLNGRVETLVSQFNLSYGAISTAVETAKRVLKTNSIEETDPNNLALALWNAFRIQARPQRDDFAFCIDTQMQRLKLAPLLRNWEKGLGDEGNKHWYWKVNFS